jgi:hypothetical protein
MTPTLVTQFQPEAVNLEAARKMSRIIPNPEFASYFEQLVVKVLELFQPNNDRLSVDLRAFHQGSVDTVDFMINNATNPVQGIPSICFQPPPGIKLLDQQTQVITGDRTNLVMKYEYRTERPRSRSHRRRKSPSSSPSPPRRKHDSPSESRSPSPRRRSPSPVRRPRSPSPLPRRRSPSSGKKSSWTLFG